MDNIIQFSLATARCVHDDDKMLQDLGPIHLIKYVYLADLAYAEKHGRTYTETNWVFHHFGPWAAEVYQRLDLATQAIHADKKQIESRYSEDFTRWRLDNYEDAVRVREEHSKNLPFEITSVVQHAVKEYGNATTDLLHDVYLTFPMLHAAPGDELDFRSVQERPEPEPPAAEPVQVSRNAMKKRKQRLEEARRRFAQKAAERSREKAARRAAQAPPRYDDVFDEGTRVLDELAGPPLEVQDGILEFSDEIWKSPIRTGEDDG
ncbi:MAG: type II toxin-antitoxin system antitoxin SocA domain-containing protein [Pseudomonadota bacterium]